MKTITIVNASIKYVFTIQNVEKIGIIYYEKQVQPKKNLYI